MVIPLDMGGDNASDASKERVRQELALRAELMKKNMLIAGQNLRVAQHRDTLRYARIRGGGYLPKIRRFAVGDFVYVQHSSETPSLGVKARAEILRVHKLGEKGALTLIGKDGGTVSVNATNCAPCHLPGIDGTIQLGLSPIPKEAPCVVCLSPAGFKRSIVCDGCDAVYHMACLSPVMKTVPAGVWHCPGCVARQQAGEKVPLQIRVTDEDRANADLDGVAIVRGKDKLAGTVRYLGSLVGTDCFEATYRDGSAEKLTARQVRRRQAVAAA